MPSPLTKCIQQSVHDCFIRFFLVHGAVHETKALGVLPMRPTDAITLRAAANRA
jgi:hypothetical protein